MEITKSIEEYINKHGLFTNTEKLLIGISGGPDSVFLVHILNKLGYQISLAHVNYQLRDHESNVDAEFVKTLAKELNLTLFTHKVDLKKYVSKNKLGIQEAARNIRYDWFKQLLSKNSLDIIVVAHHLNDNIETALLNLGRGSGLKGIKGMSPSNNNIARPLLEVKRKDIEDYLNNHEINYRTDSSNSDIKYKRNHIRNKVIPELNNIYTAFENNMVRSINNFEKEFEFLQLCLKSKLDKALIDNKKGIKCYSTSYFKDPSYNSLLIHYLLEPLGFNSTHEQQLLDSIMNNRSGAIFEMNDTIIYLERNHIAISEHKKDPDHIDLNSILDNRSCFQYFQFSITRDVQHPIQFEQNEDVLDFDKLEPPLILRKWKNGDYFYPLGMKKKKKLKKFFIDEKVPNWEKKEVWILQSGLKIAYLLDFRVDNRFKVTEMTKSVLRITKNEKLN